MNVNAQTPVGQLVAERPGRAKVLEQYGLDYCCGGKKPLDKACADKQVDVDTVVRRLLEADSTDRGYETDWTTSKLTPLCNHIVNTHHEYLREALPRIAHLTEKVRRAHGHRHPELFEVCDVFRDLSAELSFHMMKEERILFPLVKALEHGDLPDQIHCGSVGNPIRVMEHEHDHAGRALEKLRALTNGFLPPADACSTFIVMLDALAELETDLHLHVHLENNILFPRAVELEASVEH
jgi:regulator of cell morphogenesis and NO signaling